MTEKCADSDFRHETHDLRYILPLDAVDSVPRGTISDYEDAISSVPRGTISDDGYGEKPSKHDARYVHACHRSEWRLVLQKKTDPDDIHVQIARCYSWRHGGPCARAKAAEDYARTKEALDRYDVGAISYLVLTLDPSAWSGSGWGGSTRERKHNAKGDQNAITAAYRELCLRWSAFVRLARIRFRGLEYVVTVEAHKSGWPHLNAIVVSNTLSIEIDKKSNDFKDFGRKSKGREVARSIFSEELRLSGFGPIAFVERALSRESIAGYCAKLANAVQEPFRGESSQNSLVDSIDSAVIGEIVKASQVPTRAPKNFRRLRSSRGFLPAKRNRGTHTGYIGHENLSPIRAQDGARAYDLLCSTPDAIDAAIAKLREAEDRGPNERDLRIAGKWRRSNERPPDTITIPRSEYLAHKAAKGPSSVELDFLDKLEATAKIAREKAREKKPPTSLDLKKAIAELRIEGAIDIEY